MQNESSQASLLKHRHHYFGALYTNRSSSSFSSLAEQRRYSNLPVHRGSDARAAVVARRPIWKVWV